jgi:Esterase PHB depolymerase
MKATRSALIHRVALLGIVALFGADGAASAAPTELLGYAADPRQTSVSGLSSGAFMAVQLQVAYSATIVGAGVIAGGPYGCAEGNLWFTGICMGQVPAMAPDASTIVGAAKGFAISRVIDSLANLKKRRIYVFSGTQDSVVLQKAVDVTVDVFRQLGVSAAHLQYAADVPAGHAIITPTYGNSCAANAAFYISHCDVGGTPYDQAGAILQQIYGALQAKATAPDRPIVEFDQRAFAAAGSGMAASGYLYVPQACTATAAHCKVHIALHGCEQAADKAGDRFYTHAGYNAWAESNKILVLYPQIDSAALAANPSGCWDWWGYTGADYAFKSGAQMKAIMAMAERLARSH